MQPTRKPYRRARTDQPLTLHWDTLHPQSRQELGHGILRTNYAASAKWADIPRWLQEDIQTNCKTRTYGKVTVAE